MNLQAFKKALLDRVFLLKASVVFTFQKETAYFLNNWASLLSTTVYTLSMLVFIHILYANVKTIAGYSVQEMLVFFLVGQMAYYITATMSFDVMRETILLVNRGDLDLILTKPLPSLFYVTFRQIKIISTLRDGIPPTIAILFTINWETLHFFVGNFFFALIVFVCGLICLHVLQFLAMVPVFWLGESKNILKVAFAVYSESGARIPLEGMTPLLRFTLSTFIPVLIVTGFSTSILLGKSEALPLVCSSLVVAISAIIVMNILWRLALRVYTSASS